MADIVGDSIRMLQAECMKHDRVMVMLSGGKDSLTCLDLCVRVWGSKRTVGCHMWVVPGLRCIEERLDVARSRYGVEIIQVPHWLTSRWFRYGVFCFPDKKFPEVKLATVHEVARETTGIELIAHGGKRSDGMWRRRQLAKKKEDAIVYPVKDWSKWDILAYLKVRGLVANEKFDPDLTASFVLMLADQYPDDYEKLLAWYPFAEVLFYRRKYYGIGPERNFGSGTYLPG